MIKILLCTLLLSAAGQASAATLYRWIEADGSITFSPEPPAAGIAYDTVETGVGNSATSAPAQQPAVQAATPTQPLQTEVQAQSAQGLNYAPGTFDSMPNGISKADTPVPAISAAEPRNGAQNGVVVSSQKYAQCQDLKKRVVSLERRLRSKLTPGEVDNTVVAIVRYQDSFDQFCVN